MVPPESLSQYLSNEYQCYGVKHVKLTVKINSLNRKKIEIVNIFEKRAPLQNPGDALCLSDN
jgi:hypothetical protein